MQSSLYSLGSDEFSVFYFSTSLLPRNNKRGVVHTTYVLVLTITMTGKTPVATLYAAYALAEHLGARFYLHGDALPGSPVSTTLLLRPVALCTAPHARPDALPIPWWGQGGGASGALHGAPSSSKPQCDSIQH